MSRVPVLVLFLVALSGCITVTPSVLSTSGPGVFARGLNEQSGTDFSERMLLTGLGAGMELPGGLAGVHATTLRGSQQSATRDGVEQEIALRVTDATLTLGYPLQTLGDRATLVVGGEWTLRSTSIGGNKGTAFILRPRMGIAVPLSAWITATPHVAYDVPVFDNETLFEVGGEPVRAAMSGFNVGVSLTYGSYGEN